MIVFLRCERRHDILAGQAVGISYGESESQHFEENVVGYSTPRRTTPHRRQGGRIDDICDQLEAQLATTEADSRRLLEAVLHEALAPALEETA